MIKLQKNKGITLIALVVTIVVLIILSTISINIAIGNKGVINKAELSKDMTSNSAKQEEEDMNSLVKEYEGMMIEMATAGTELTKPETWTSTQVTPISDGRGNVIPLPNGFYYVGGDRSTGLVISDNSADEGKGTSYEVAGTLQGNQYVWIPVDSEGDLTRTNFDDSGNPTTDAPSAGMNMTDYSEPYSEGYETEEAEYNTMRTQVLLYGGFYIGRYEAGDGTNGTTLRTLPTTAHAVVVKKGVAPYNYVAWGISVSDIDSDVEYAVRNEDGEKIISIDTKGAAYLSKNLATQNGYTSVVSTLTYGCQWDAMCRYIEDSGRTTPTKSAVELTGNVSTDVSKNIYDLAGNCSEWTMECYKNVARADRGGNYEDNYAVSFRGGTTVGLFRDFFSFRCALYIK